MLSLASRRRRNGGASNHGGAANDGGAASDAGFTLAEMVITMTLMTIVGAMATSFFVANQQVSRKTLERGFNTASARVTLDSWSGLLRVADSNSAPGLPQGRFLKITPTEIRFYAGLRNRDASIATTGAPSMIDLALENGSLVETHFNDAGAQTVRRVLATNVSATGWVFTPYSGTTDLSSSDTDCKIDGTASIGYCSTGMSDGSGTASGDATLALVNRIDIAFTASDRADLAPTTFTSSVYIGGT